MQAAIRIIPKGTINLQKEHMMNFPHKTLLASLPLISLVCLSGCASGSTVNSASVASPSKPQTVSVATAPKAAVKNNQPELEYDP